MRAVRSSVLSILSAAGLAACAAAAPPSSGPSAQAPARVAATARDFQRDRAAILAMAGNYDVAFDFQETVALEAGYEPKERYRTGAQEVVRVIADTDDFISLQHILVVGGDEKFPVKHWRQDWRYEPDSVLVYVGGNAWEHRPVAAEDAKGKWSQTVYQVGDAPRYGAVGAWSHEAGVSEWDPPAEWRPLPRRDATKRDDYHAIDAVNRLVITPWGWAHEQDNTKLALDGGPHALVREIGVNTYRRTDDIDVSIAEDYWRETAPYWAEVRAKWSAIEAANPRFGLSVQGEPEAVYAPLLDLAEQIREGRRTTEAATREARATIDGFTITEIGDVETRIAASGY